MQFKFNTERWLFALLCIPFIFNHTFAQQRKANSVDKQILALGPAVRNGKLANGFTYFIRHNEEPKNRVVLYLVNKAGHFATESSWQFHRNIH